jgi:hypothetical protein
MSALRNRKHEYFAREVAALTPYDRAYREAGFGGDPRWHRYNASKLANKPHIKARITHVPPRLRLRAANEGMIRGPSKIGSVIDQSSTPSDIPNFRRSGSRISGARSKPAVSPFLPPRDLTKPSSRLIEPMVDHGRSRRRCWQFNRRNRLGRVPINLAGKENANNQGNNHSNNECPYTIPFRSM